MLLKKQVDWSAVVLLLLLTISSAMAAGDSHNLGRQNYILMCQGCHLPDASGSPGVVPRMNNFVANFLHVDGGREFIVQVPGSANAPINDQELADVLNWMLENFSQKQIPENFVPYSSEEVGKLRRKPLIDVNGARAALITRIQDKLGIKEDGLNDS
jgi:hypothetical protein